MNVTGTIDGNQISGYVRSLNRVQQLCNPTQIATLVLSTDFPNGVMPAMEVVLYQEGVKVMTGYVVKAYREAPAYDWKVEVHDTYTRCVSYFIEDKITVGYDAYDKPIPGYTALTTDYWIGYLCGLAGVSYTSSGGTGTVPAGVQIGLRSVHESLTDVIAYSSQYVRANADGVLKFERINRDAPNYTLESCISVDDTTSDEWTRNVVKVYGYTGQTDRIFAMASTGVEGLVPDRVTAVGAPMIETQDEANRVASYLLDELGDMTRVVTARIEGNPNIHIGHAARIIYSDTDYTDAVTTVSNNIDENGYITDVTIGERCPRIAGWSKSYPMIYAGTTQHGVYISRDGGGTWAAFNDGLPTGNKYVPHIGANSFEEAMAIVNGYLYYTDGTNPWTIRSLPAPINSAGDDPAPGYGSLITVDALGGEGQFSVLTTTLLASGSSGSATFYTTGSTQYRSWVYTCESTGSSAELWQSVQIGKSSSGSALDYKIFGVDMKSSLGVPYVLGNTGGVYPLGGRYAISKNDSRRIMHYESGFDNVCYAAPSNYGLIDWEPWGAGWSGSTFIFYLYAYTWTGTFKDNVFVYGSRSSENKESGYDESGFHKWEYQYDFTWDSANVMYSPPYRWYCTMALSDFDPVPLEGRYQEFFHFNVFWSPKQNLNRKCIVIADTCDFLQVGLSPWGDVYGFFGQGGPKDPATPYPIRSSISSGVLFAF